MGNIYMIGVVAASASMLITGLILTMVKTPGDGRAAKLRQAKRALTAAVLILGVLNIVQMGVDNRGAVSHLGACFALSMSYLQAMLFTTALLVLIRPEEVTRRVVTLQFVAIFMVDTLLIGSFFLLPVHTFLYIYWLGVVLYLLQLAFYVRWLRRSRTLFQRQIEQYYEDEEISRSLRWVYVIFWAAIAVALLALLMMLNNLMVAMTLTILFAIFYALFAACLINYSLSAPVILPAIYSQSPAPSAIETESSKEQGKRLTVSTDKMEQWIKDKGYLGKDKAVAEISAQVDMSVDELHQYFRDVIGEEFRTWRVRRRIDEARRLMAEHPEYSTAEIGRYCGFNDRSFFYHQFLRFTGSTVADYRQQLAGQQG